MANDEWRLRVAPSLGGGFAGSPYDVWNIKEYNPDIDSDKNLCAFGLYGLPDFYALWRHKGRKAILWAGSDIKHFVNGYWLEDGGGIRMSPYALATWINKYCENWVENEVEWAELKKVGIDAKICPSFLGNVDDFKTQKLDKEERYYSSVSGDDFKTYGWDKINEIAEATPHVKYYLYGNRKPWKAPKNVIVRGRVPHEVMNEETRSMTGAIRMTEFDGCSELIVKSVLWGQKPISRIHYPFLEAKDPRKELLSIVNKFSWNQK